MHTFGRIFVLAACVFSAIALPSFNGVNNIDDQSIFQLVVAQVRSALIDTRALSPAETVCANNYNNQTQKINNNLTNQTNVCFENANKTTVANAQNANVTVSVIRADLLAVQQQLATCNNQTDTNLFLNCTTSSFDANLERMDRANSQSYQILAQQNANLTQVEFVRQACVSAAIGTAKTNLTQAANDYNTCLNVIKNQRMPSSLLISN